MLLRSQIQVLKPGTFITLYKWVAVWVSEHQCQVIVLMRKLGAMPRIKVFLINCLCLSVSGIMLLLLCFFAFLHCWLNLFGELLRFADRMFYKVCGTRLIFCGIISPVNTLFSDTLTSPDGKMLINDKWDYSRVAWCSQSSLTSPSSVCSGTSRDWVLCFDWCVPASLKLR